MAPKITVTILGTGSGIPSVSRWHAAVALSFEGENILFDCGEGAQIRLQQAGINPMKMGRIFVTHFHPDHFLGLPGLLASMALNGRTEPVQVFCPKGTGRRLAQFVRLCYDGRSFPLSFKEVTLPSKPTQIFSGGSYSILAAKADHGTPALAYCFAENDRNHLIESRIPRELRNKPLSRTKAALLARKKFSAFRTERGRRLVYSGDTAPCESVAQLAKGADVLIHEATFAAALQARAKEYMHSTTEDAARIAKKAKVKLLVISHFSRRMEREPGFEGMKLEAARIFPNTVAASDLQWIEL